jgi:hypothetical protein
MKFMGENLARLQYSTNSSYTTYGMDWSQVHTHIPLLQARDDLYRGLRVGQDLLNGGCPKMNNKDVGLLNASGHSVRYNYGQIY